MSTRVSSRIARHEQKKLIRQSMMMVGATIILITLFIFVILPQSVGLVGRLTGANLVIGPVDTIPPQVPVFAAPAPATPSAQITLTGYGEPKSEVVLIVNASEQSRQTLGDDGQFSFEVSLTEGENIISGYAIDESKNESSPSRTMKVIMDNEPPRLEIAEPQEGQSIELRKNQILMVKGATDQGTRIYVNDRLASTQADGNFSASYQLQEGENILKIVAEDQAGNVTTAERKVTFRL